jgi:cobalt-zinc-cadmium efflux system membrane fusion protein
MRTPCRHPSRLAWLAAIAFVPLVACRPAPVVEEPSAPASTEIAVAPQALAAGTVTVDAAVEIERAERLAATAVLTLDESRTSRIGSMVDGIVMFLDSQVGDRVSKGAVLGGMHSAVVHEAWAAYRKAMADRRRQETELNYAQQSEARAERLLAARALSEQEVARAHADRIAAQEGLDMARTEVRRSEEELEHLGITSGDDPTGESGEQIPVRTPIAGVVLERLVTAGTAVTPGTPLFVVSDLSQLWAVAEVDEARLSTLVVGRTADVTVSAYPGARFPARVTFIGDTVNPSTRRVTVRCVVPNADRRLKPNMYASVSLGTGEPRRVVAVPAAAVQEMNGTRVVFVESASGRFLSRSVVTGEEENGRVEIEKGLAAGERVAVRGSFLLKSQAMNTAAPGA